MPSGWRATGACASPKGGRSTKAIVLPATCSARAHAASLAEWMASALSSSSTVNVSPCFRYTCEPPILLALAETVTISSIVRSPSAMWSRTINSVIILSIEAG